MDEQIKDGGPAFPEPGVYDASREQINPVGAYYDAGGMSLRDYFAAKALNAVCDRYMLMNCDSEPEIEMEITNAAFLAYRLSAAMLAAREAQS